MQDFSARLIAWQRRHGRHDLPWQVADPYRIWLSEIMLQQTQVETVIPYYRRFLERFPDVASLAAARQDEVLALWSGLGYYARARNLHAAARQVIAGHAGVFPGDYASLVDLPGVGRSTAAAIAVFARGERRAILDGNVKRVLCRVFGVEGWPGERAVENRLWALAEALLPKTDIGRYTQGLMDLGATLCRRGRPDCQACPYQDDCLARRQGRIAELPAARPRRGLPEKATRMLVLRHAGALLFEKRPASGIWGGAVEFSGMRRRCRSGGGGACLGLHRRAGVMVAGADAWLQPFPPGHRGALVGCGMPAEPRRSPGAHLARPRGCPGRRLADTGAQGGPGIDRCAAGRAGD